MQRRKFIKTAALSAVAVSATGFIRFDGNRYVSDCETTSDILGPFYRPDSPVRKSLVISGAKGELIELVGTVQHNDCVTPFKNAKVELWHCDGEGVYDNSSNEYRYRGTTFTDEKGHYSFNTILPVPYDAGGGLIRPAHFHLMITAKGYPPLVTQLYFSGDSNIRKDPWASSAIAKRRILEVQQLNNGTKRVLFNVSLAGKVAAEPASMNKLIGVYTGETDKTRKAEIFRKDDSLWLKNAVFGNQFEYAGNNSFRYPDESGEVKWTLHFEVMKTGAVKLTESTQEGAEGKTVSVFIKEK
ncbi:MAG: catechol 1,2-dioxygenase [Chitinophagaceae bacterium]|nr:catechol 1,2-dioxygenase [Chitinophagaceae bacterium]